MKQVGGGGETGGRGGEGAGGGGETGGRKGLGGGGMGEGHEVKVAAHTALWASEMEPTATMIMRFRWNCIRFKRPCLAGGVAGSVP